MSEPKHASSNQSVPTPKQVADATARVAAAFETVRQAVLLQTHADGGTDPVAVTAVAANARLAMAAGGLYLLARIDPATPQQLADAARSFGEILQDIAMNALAGISNDEPAQAARLRQAEIASEWVAALCR